MKKYLSILLVTILFACSDSDDLNSNIAITEVFSDYSNVPNEHGKYVNYFGAHVLNSNSKDVIGHVRFTVKNYGTIDSYKHVVKANNESQTYYEVALETESRIDESYLLKTDFVRD